MKKIFLSLLFVFVCSAAIAEIKCLNKSGFISEKFNYLKKNYKIDDPYDGKTSNWLKNIKSINFIETPTSKENWKINGKSCKAKISKQWYGFGYGHHVMEAKCMPEYFPQIVKYFQN